MGNEQDVSAGPPRLASATGMPVPPMVSEVPADRSALAARIRELVDASVLSDAGTAELRAAADQIAAVTELLGARPRDSAQLLAPLVDGGYISVNNPVEGPGNALAPPLAWSHTGADSVLGRVVFSVSHEGPPGRVHGGWVAAVIDHAVGRAVAAAGFPAMTASLTVNFRAGTPFGVPLDVAARFIGRDGRKVYAAGEVRAGGQVTATATATLVSFEGRTSAS